MRKAKTDPGNMDQKPEQLENEISVKKNLILFTFICDGLKKNAACGDNSGLDDIFYDYY